MFVPREKVYKLLFVTPSSFTMHKQTTDKISIQINGANPGECYGIAFVPALSKDAAKEKISRIVEIMRWIESE